MAEVTINKALELKTSRSGRLLIPRLRNWTGERVVMKKTGLVQVLDGSPDCTSSFLSERKLFQAASSLGLSQSLNVSRVRERSPSKLVKRKGSESLPIRPNQREISKRGPSLGKPNPSLKKNELTTNVASRGRSPTKKIDVPPIKSKLQSVKVLQSRLDKPEPTRESRSLSRNASSGRSPRLKKVSQVSRRRSSPLKGRNIPSSKSHKRETLPTRSSPRKKSNVSPTKPEVETINPSATRSSPRKKRDASPSKTSKTKTIENGNLQKHVITKLEKRGKGLRTKSERDQPIPVKLEENNMEPDVDIFGSEFQPVVRLVRLLPEEVLSITFSPNHGTISSPQKGPLESERNSSSRKRKSPSDCNVKTPVKTKIEKSPWKMKISPLRASRRTVRGTQKLLEALGNRNSPNEIEDEAASTGAFFKNSRTNALKNLNEVDDILNDDFGESDDNLSFRSTYERESSPMPSVPVSPISSFVETDAENSGWEDGLLGESPIVVKTTSFQKAQLLHRTLKNRAAVAKKLSKLRKETDENSSSTVFPPIAKATTNPVPCPLLQPKAMLALEKNLKKKAKNGEKLQFDALYRGNTLHISLNSSDSESSEDSFDSD